MKEEAYLRANIKGEYHEVRLGYFILSIPIEFAVELASGEFNEISSKLLDLSDWYDENVLGFDEKAVEKAENEKKQPAQPEGKVENG